MQVVQRQKKYYVPNGINKENYVAICSQIWTVNLECFK